MQQCGIVLMFRIPPRMSKDDNPIDSANKD